MLDSCVQNTYNSLQPDSLLPVRKPGPTCMRYRLQNEHIFFAPSLSEVMRQLLSFRPTGVLTIWRAEGPRQEDARIAIEHGYPTHVLRGLHWEHASAAILACSIAGGHCASHLQQRSHIYLYQHRPRG